MDDPERVTLTFEEMDAIYDPYRPNLQNGALLVNDNADQFEGNGLDINTNDLQSDIVPYDGDNIDTEIPGIATVNTAYTGPVMTQVRGNHAKAKSLVAKVGLRVYAIRKDLFLIATSRQKSTMLATHGSHFRYYGSIHSKVTGSKDSYVIQFTMFPFDDQQLTIRRDKFIVCTPGMVSQFNIYNISIYVSYIIYVCIYIYIYIYIYHLYVYINMFI
jgi:hypothetical protein